MKKPEISVVIPVYNEQNRLEKNIKQLVRHLNKIRANYEIILSDDGSTDNTLSIIRKLSQNAWIRYSHYKKNKGRGYALKKSCSLIKGSKVVFMDADIPLTINPEIIEKILKNLDKYDVVIASRVLPMSKTKRKIHRKILSKIYRALVRLFFPKLNVSDSDVGFKGFKKNVFVSVNKEVESNGWQWDLEFMLECRKRNKKIKEIPLKWQEEGKSSVNIIKTSWAQFLSLFILKKKYGNVFNR